MVFLSSSVLRYHKLGLFCLVPFDEDDKDRSVWFLDHDYLENMYSMFKKVNGESHHFLMGLVEDCFFL